MPILPTVKALASITTNKPSSATSSRTGAIPSQMPMPTAVITSSTPTRAVPHNMSKPSTTVTPIIIIPLRTLPLKMPTVPTLVATKIAAAAIVIIIVIVTLTTDIVALPSYVARIPTIEAATTVGIAVAAVESTGEGSAAFYRSATRGSDVNRLVLVVGQ